MVHYIAKVQIPENPYCNLYPVMMQPFQNWIFSPWWTFITSYKAQKLAVIEIINIHWKRVQGKMFIASFQYLNEETSIALPLCNNWNTILTFCNKSCFEITVKEDGPQGKGLWEGVEGAAYVNFVYKFSKWKCIKKFTPSVIYERLNSQTFHSFFKKKSRERTTGRKFYCQNLKFLHVFRQRNKRTSQKVSRDLWNLKINFLILLRKSEYQTQTTPAK